MAYVTLSHTPNLRLHSTAEENHPNVFRVGMRWKLWPVAPVARRGIWFLGGRTGPEWHHEGCSSPFHHMNSKREIVRDGLSASNSCLGPLMSLNCVCSMTRSHCPGIVDGHSGHWGSTWSEYAGNMSRLGWTLPCILLVSLQIFENPWYLILVLQFRETGEMFH